MARRKFAMPLVMIWIKVSSATIFIGISRLGTPGATQYDTVV